MGWKRPLEGPGASAENSRVARKLAAELQLRNGKCASFLKTLEELKEVGVADADIVQIMSSGMRTMQGEIEQLAGLRAWIEWLQTNINKVEGNDSTLERFKDDVRLSYRTLSKAFGIFSEMVDARLVFEREGGSDGTAEEAQAAGA